MWYVYDPVGKKQVALGPDKDKALTAWHAMHAVTRPDAPNATLFSVLEAHLKWSRKNQSASTYDGKKLYLGLFCKARGHIPVADLKRRDLTTWLDDRDFSDGAARGAITAIKSALNWAVDEEYISSNPFARVKKPPVGRREQLVSAADRMRIINRTDRPFRLFAIALSHLGSRPRQVREVTAERFDEKSRAWVFPPGEHKTGRKTGRKLVVHLTPCMFTLSRILASARPNGPLFLNRLRKPWTHNAVRCRMRRMRDFLDLPEGTVSYSFRHTFATNGLANGVDSSTMAQLLGHGDTSMIDRHYGHLDQRQEHLRAAIRKVRSQGQTQDKGDA